MKLPLFLAALGGSVLGVVGSRFLLSPTPAAATDGATLAELRAAIEDNARSQQAGLDSVRAQLRELENRPAPLVSEARLPLGEIEAAVERALAKRQGSATPAAEASASTTSTTKRNAKDLFAQLQAGNLSEEARRALWREAKESGELNQLLAMFEQRAKDNPNSAEAQLAYGNACLERLFAGAQGPEAGIWASKADKAFDAALVADPTNWDARFTKAVSLSNWPAFLGKQNQAIAEFQTLIAQQEQGPAQPQYVSTYTILGNMHLQMGNKDKALAVWNQGLALFPNDAGLLQQIQSTKQQ